MAKRTSGSSRATLPHDELAERYVIGIALATPEVLKNGRVLEPYDFFDKGNASLFQAVLSAVQNDTYDENSLSQLTGLSTADLKALRDKAPDPSQYAVYEAKIRECAGKRRLMAVCDQVSQECWNPLYSLDDVISEAKTAISSLDYQSKSGEKLVEVEKVIISVSESPKYTVHFRMASEVLAVTLSSDELDKREIVKRKIREVFHEVPILPDKDAWDDFVSHMLEMAEKEIAPEETSESAVVAFWMREWKKVACEAETPDDLMRGYVSKDGFIFFQPERVRSWIVNASKFPWSAHNLWMILKRHGALRKSIRVSNKADSSRKMWGLPEDFFTSEHIEAPEEVDLSLFD